MFKQGLKKIDVMFIIILGLKKNRFSTIWIYPYVSILVRLIHCTSNGVIHVLSSSLEKSSLTDHF